MDENEFIFYVVVVVVHWTRIVILYTVQIKDLLL